MTKFHKALSRIVLIMYLIIFIIEGTMVLESGRRMVCRSEWRSDTYCGVEQVKYPSPPYPIMNG